MNDMLPSDNVPDSLNTAPSDLEPGRLLPSLQDFQNARTRADDRDGTALAPLEIVRGSTPATKDSDPPARKKSVLDIMTMAFVHVAKDNQTSADTSKPSHDPVGTLVTQSLLLGGSLVVQRASNLFGSDSQAQSASTKPPVADVEPVLLPPVIKKATSSDTAGSAQNPDLQGQDRQPVEKSYFGKLWSAPMAGSAKPGSDLDPITSSPRAPRLPADSKASTGDDAAVRHIPMDWSANAGIDAQQVLRPSRDVAKALEKALETASAGRLPAGQLELSSLPKVVEGTRGGAQDGSDGKSSGEAHYLENGHNRWGDNSQSQRSKVEPGAGQYPDNPEGKRRWTPQDMVAALSPALAIPDAKAELKTAPGSRSDEQLARTGLPADGARQMVGIDSLAKLVGGIDGKGTLLDVPGARPSLTEALNTVARKLSDLVPAGMLEPGTFIKSSDSSGRGASTVLVAATGLDPAGIKAGVALDVAGLTTGVIHDVAGIKAGAVQDTSGAKVGVVQDMTGAKTGAAQDTSGAKVGVVQDMTGAKTGAAQDTSGAKVGVVQDIAGAKTGAVQDTSGAKVGVIQDIAGAKAGVVQDIIGAKTGAVQDIIGAKTGAVQDTSGAKAGAVQDIAGAKAGVVQDVAGGKGVGVDSSGAKPAPEAANIVTPDKGLVSSSDTSSTRGGLVTGAVVGPGSIVIAPPKSEGKKEGAKTEKDEDTGDGANTATKDPGVGLGQFVLGTSTPAGQTSATDPSTDPTGALSPNNGIQLQPINLPNVQIFGQDPGDPGNTDPAAGTTAVDPSNGSAGPTSNSADPVIVPADPNISNVTPVAETQSACITGPVYTAPVAEPQTTVLDSGSSAASPAACQPESTCVGVENPEHDLENDRQIIERIDQQQTCLGQQAAQDKTVRIDMIDQTSDGLSSLQSDYIQATFAALGEQLQNGDGNLYGAGDEVRAAGFMTQLGEATAQTINSSAAEDNELLRFLSQKEREEKERRENEERARQEEIKRNEAMLVALKARQAEEEANRARTRKDRSEIETRRPYLVMKGDTLESIALNQMMSERLAGLIYEINKSRIPLVVIEGNRLLQLKPGLVIFLPARTEIKSFLSSRLARRFQKFEYETMTSGARKSGSATGDRAQSRRRALVESLLGKLDEPEEQARVNYVCRLGDSLRSVAVRHPALQAVSLWKLLAQVNKLSTQTDSNGQPLAELRRGMVILLPSADEIAAFCKNEAVNLRI